MLCSEANGSLAVHTPAKLNLFLEILAKRSDGYHELETLMVTVDWYDTLVVRPISDSEPPHPSVLSDGAGSAARLDSESKTADATCGETVPQSGSGATSSPIALPFKEETLGPVRLTCRSAGSPGSSTVIPTGDGNLIVRAAKLLQQATGFRGGVAIDLVKRIPMEAGLAGGSSDAAATLWACNRVWKLGLAPSELAALAAQLGSDIAFFLADEPAAVCRGRGERVEPVRLPAGLNFVIAKPAGGLSTALVYRNCRPSTSPASVEPLLRSLQSGRLQDAGALLHNALQEPAERLSSDVSHLRSLFSQLPVSGHLMSGSGTAYFALCAHRRQALSVAARLRAAGVQHVAAVQSRS